MKPSQFSSRSKSGLGWGVVFLILSCFGFVAVMETRRPELADPEYGLRLVRFRQRLAEKAPGQKSICIFGSSRVVGGIRPDRMLATPEESADKPAVFNFGVFGAGPVMELCYLRRLLADGVRPDWVFAEVWPPYLYQGPDAWSEENRIDVARFLHRDLPILSRYFVRPRQLYRKWYKGQMQPWLMHRNFFLSLYAPSWLPAGRRLDTSWKTLDRWGWLEAPEYQLDAAARQRLLDHGREILAPALAHFQVSDVADRALRELVTVCHQEKIGVGFIFLPEASQCRSWYPPAAQTRTDDFLRQLSRECAVPVINARQWVPDSEFSDGYHLMRDGAGFFSELLAKRALRPLIANHPLAADDLWPDTH